MSAAADAFVAGQRDVLEGIAKGAPLPHVLERIVRLIEEQAAGMLCSILLLDADHGCVRHGAAPSLPAAFSQAIDGAAIGPVAGSCGTAAYRGEPVVVADIATDPLWALYKDLALPHGLRACWSSPIFSADHQVLGTFAMYYQEPRGPSAAEREWVSVATHLAAVALGRHRTEQALRQSEARARQLVRLYAVSSSVNEAISRVRDPARLYEHACRIAVEQGLMRLAWVGLYDAIRDRLVPIARAGVDDGYVDRITVGVRDERTGGGPAARALREGRPIVTNDIAGDPGFYWKAEAEARGLRSCAAFPITLQGRPVGVLAMYAEQPGYFGDEDLRVLTALADDIAFGVESAATEAERQRVQTELARRLAELQDANQRLAFHVSRMPLAYIVWGQDLVVTEWNPAAERIFGWSAAEAIGRHAFELMVPAEAQPEVERGAADLLTGAGAAQHFVGAGVRKDGHRVVCEWFNAPLRDAAGRIRGYLSMAHDVTDRQRAEEERTRLEGELRQAQRIQSLGTLAGGIAHDFNNVLTAIIGNTDIAALALPADHPAQRSLRHVAQASARAADLVKRILTFSRRQEPLRSRLRLQPVVEEALRLLRATLPASVEIRPRFDAATPEVMADATQVYQVVMNLGTNAAHAMGSAGGCIEVQLEPVSVTAAMPGRPPDLPEGRYAMLTVADTGCGMDAATLDRIFEPFFTTKPVGEGTGLGLSVVHGIVQSHDGAIAVESRPGGGTTFRVYVPSMAATAGEAAGVPAAVTTRGHGEHVLYVDDEEALVYMTTRILERLGYRVTAFTDAREALAAFRARPADFDAVVTDLALPGVPGLELAREIRRIRPEMPLVLTSGYVQPHEAPGLREIAGAELVLKPNTVAGLGPALARLLYSSGTKTDTRGSGPTSRVM